MKKSKLETAETRRRIVKAAAAEFRRNGIHATGLCELMAAVGLTHGGFYRHFDSKDQLVTEACAAGMEAEIDGAAVTSTVNFATETIFDVEGDRIPPESMLMITLADNRRIAVRPSGTEPKIKYYTFAAEPLAEGKTLSASELEPVKARVTASLDSLWKALKKDAGDRLSA